MITLGLDLSVRNLLKFLTLNSKITYCGLDITLRSIEGKGGSRGTCITLDQQVDLESYLADLGVKGTKTVANPMPDKYALYKLPELLNATESSKYRSIVGALGFYVTALRYDIAYPLSRLAQFSCRPTVGSMKALQLALAYLKCSTDFSLQGPIIPEGMTTPSSSNPNPNPIPNNNPNSDPIRLSNSHGDVLTVYSDSDHAGHRDEHSHSQSGLLVMLNHTPVFWRSAKQGSIALSSATAEIYALSEAVKNARLFQWRGQELGLPF